MDTGVVIAGIIGAAFFIYLIYVIDGLPGKLDQKMRSQLVEYKKWADGDDRHIRQLDQITKRQDQLVDVGNENLDYLRIEKARIKVELDRLEDLNVFLNTLDSEAERRKYSQLEEIENKIDEHPDRERELEETRSRLVARMEDIRRLDADPGAE